MKKLLVLSFLALFMTSGVALAEQNASTKPCCKGKCPIKGKCKCCDDDGQISSLSMEKKAATGKVETDVKGVKTDQKAKEISVISLSDENDCSVSVKSKQAKGTCKGKDKPSQGTAADSKEVNEKEKQFYSDVNEKVISTIEEYTKASGKNFNKKELVTKVNEELDQNKSFMHRNPGHIYRGCANAVLGNWDGANFNELQNALESCIEMASIGNL